MFLLHWYRLQFCLVLTPRVYPLFCCCLIVPLKQCSYLASVLVSKQTFGPYNTIIGKHLKKHNHQRTKQPKMTLTFKFLPHEILNKPKPVPVCIYPLYPHEFFIREASDPFQACDHHSCPPLITEPRNHITKKKKK